MISKFLWCALLAVPCAFASGGTAPSPAPAGTPEVRISTEMTPPGGTAQIKVSFTNPTPIMSGGVGFGSMETFGISLWSPAGDAAGVGVLREGKLFISTLSPVADLGTNVDYPFLTVTMHMPLTAKAGDTVSLNPAFALNGPAGPVSVVNKPGSLITGGSFYIHGVTPGGGTWPAGTTIRVEGTGFAPNAQLRAPQMKVASYRVINSGEIDFVLKEATTIDGQAVQVTSGGVTRTYYSYLRGVAVRQPSRSFLISVEPVFPLVTHALATVSSLEAAAQAQYTALAVQNPNPGPAAVTLTLTHTDGTTGSSLIVLSSGGKIFDEIGGLVNSTVQAGDSLSLSSTAAVQILGVRVDETGPVTPFLPLF